MLNPFLVTIFNLLLHRLQESVKASKKVPYCKHFIHNLCVFSAVYGSQPLFTTLESITSGLVTMLVMNIWSENRTQCAQLDSQEVKHILVGGTKLLCETALANNPDSFKSLFESLFALVHESEDNNGHHELVLDENPEDRAFDSAYSKLAYALVPNVDPCADIASGPVYFITTVSSFTKSRPGQYGNIITAALASAAGGAQAFETLLKQNGLTIA